MLEKIMAYQFGKTKVTGGCQFDLKSSSSKINTGSTITVAREFLIKEFPFEIQGLLMYNPFSELVHESNFGVLVNKAINNLWTFLLQP